MGPPWPLSNHEEISHWQVRDFPDPDLIEEVVRYIVRIQNEAPSIGLEVSALGAGRQFHALVDSGLASVTWIFIGPEYKPIGGWIYLKAIHSLIPPVSK